MTHFERNTPYSPTPDNRPAALAYSPLELTRHSNAQMSFGERAALEGILAQVRPRVAIEIGTADGGSLERIAAYSQEVHSIDLVPSPVATVIGPHVKLHTGPSAQLLPQLLEELNRKATLVDFALVDGDHSFAGVVNDTKRLLESPTTARSVILIHDSMNAEVRAGIESIEFDEYEKVVYHEPDFVPGYVYREGAARHSAWGGLCLILCDAHRSEQYSPSTRQWRYYEPYDAIHRMRANLLSARTDGVRPQAEEDTDGSTAALAVLNLQLAAARAELTRQAQLLHVVTQSHSWRLTAPLRAVARRMRAHPRRRAD